MDNVPFCGHLSYMDSFPGFLSTGEIFERICVRAPYFALQNITRTKSGLLTADVPIQQELGSEVGPISAAEAGRHLAILGLCASSLELPSSERHYFLAHSARYERLGSNLNNEIGRTKVLRGKAFGQIDGKRKARAESFFECPTGKNLIRLIVHYHVLSEKAFARLYQSRRRQDFSGAELNPYTRKIAAKVLARTATSAISRVDAILPEWCVGHFPNYPALPVAVVLSLLGDAAGDLFLSRHSLRKGFLVRHASVEAENLAFAGESLHLETRFLGIEGGGERFQCTATTAQGLVVGYVETVIEAGPLRTSSLASSPFAELPEISSP